VLRNLDCLDRIRRAGCGRLEAFGELCLHKADPFQPLGALARLR
jgi:hypothetical protein